MDGHHVHTNKRRREPGPASQLRRPERRAIHSAALIGLLLNREVRQCAGHDAAGRRAGHECILAKVSNGLVLAQKVLVQKAAAIEIL